MEKWGRGEAVHLELGNGETIVSELISTNEALVHLRGWVLLRDCLSQHWPWGRKLSPDDQIDSDFRSFPRNGKMVSCETELLLFVMLLQSQVMRERPLIWTILHYMDDETTILMLIILFYKFVNFFLFFKTWVKWAGSGMESGRSDQSPDPLEGKDHQRLEKVTMIWMSVIFKFLECHWVTCQWPTWTPIWWLIPWLPSCDRFWWPTLTPIWWPDYGDLYLDCHKTSRLPGQAPSPLAPAAVCHHYHQCQYQIEDHRIPNTEDCHWELSILKITCPRRDCWWTAAGKWSRRPSLRSGSTW